MTQKSNLPRTKEQIISYFKLRAIIGWLGIALPLILVIGNWGVTEEVTQWSGTCMSGDHPAFWKNAISENFYSRMSHFFTGILFFLGCLLFTYRGAEKIDNRLANWAAAFALGVAFFPCKHCEDYIRWIHFGSAVLMFLIFGIFALFLFTKTDPDKNIEVVYQQNPRKKYRNRIYQVCGLIIFACLIACGIAFLLEDKKGLDIGYSIFILESVMLVAFGISWLVKSDHFLSGLLADSKS